jgi:hypothetical protein
MHRAAPGGWLLFPAIGLFVSPLLTLVTSADDVMPVAARGTYATIGTRTIMGANQRMRLGHLSFLDGCGGVCVSYFAQVQYRSESAESGLMVGRDRGAASQALNVGWV